MYVDRGLGVVETLCNVVFYPRLKVRSLSHLSLISALIIMQILTGAVRKYHIKCTAERVVFSKWF